MVHFEDFRALDIVTPSQALPDPEQFFNTEVRDVAMPQIFAFFAAALGLLVAVLLIRALVLK